MRELMCLLIGFFLLAGCAGPFYRNRLCEDVGDDLWNTMNYCERTWYSSGMGYKEVKQWCRTPNPAPLPPGRAQ